MGDRSGPDFDQERGDQARSAFFYRYTVPVMIVVFIGVWFYLFMSGINRIWALGGLLILGVVAKILCRFNFLLLVTSTLMLLIGLININTAAIGGYLGGLFLGDLFVYCIPVFGVILAISMLYETDPIGLRAVDTRWKIGLGSGAILFGYAWILLTGAMQGVLGYPVSLYCLGVVFAIGPFIALSRVQQFSSVSCVHVYTRKN